MGGKRKQPHKECKVRAGTTAGPVGRDESSRSSNLCLKQNPFPSGIQQKYNPYLTTINPPLPRPSYRRHFQNGTRQWLRTINTAPARKEPPRWRQLGRAKVWRYQRRQIRCRHCARHYQVRRSTRVSPPRCTSVPRGAEQERARY